MGSVIVQRHDLIPSLYHLLVKFAVEDVDILSLQVV